MKTIKFNEFIYNRFNLTSETLGREVFYGILKPIGTAEINGSLYFLHGGDGDDEQFMISSLFEGLSSTVLDILKKRRIQLVFPSIALSFLKEDKENQKESYSDYFLKEVLSAAELETRTDSNTRFLMGGSMGGHAALNMMFRRPELFTGVGVFGAGIVDFNPYNIENGEEYRKSTGILDGYFKVLLNCYHGTFKTELEYNRHDPIQLLANLSKESLKNKAIWLDVGAQDEFGLYRGTKALSQALRKREIPHQFDLVPEQGHTMEYVKMNLSKVMEYLL